MSSERTKTLCRGALVIALSAVLSMITVFKSPYGGSVTAASMVPLLVFSVKNNTGWSVLTAFCYSLIQMLLGGIYPPPVRSIFNYVLVVLLDYVLAYTVLGLCGTISRRFKSKTAGILTGAVSALLLRFICHFISGIIIWGIYANPGQPKWLYSLIYNGGYMGCEIVLSVIVLAVISRTPLLKDKT